MQQDGNMRVRKTFPQLPGGTVKNPKFIQTKQGNKLLIDGWWAYARKPVSGADQLRHARGPLSRDDYVCEGSGLNDECPSPILLPSAELHRRLCAGFHLESVSVE